MGCSTSRLNAGDVPIVMELRSGVPTELVGNDGVRNRVSAGQWLKEAPIRRPSSTRKSSMPASLRATATPMPAAPPPMMIVSYKVRFMVQALGGKGASSSLMAFNCQ